eukprot:6606269-Prymnesium_polylepis.1
MMPEHANGLADACEGSVIDHAKDLVATMSASVASKRKARLLDFKMRSVVCEQILNVCAKPEPEHQSRFGGDDDDDDDDDREL